MWPSGSNGLVRPPASPSVTMQYVTSMPSSVHRATVPAAPKSTSSGWAVTTRARSTASSSSSATPPTLTPRATAKRPPADAGGYRMTPVWPIE